MVFTFDILDRMLPNEDRLTLIQPIKIAYEGMALMIEQNSVFRTVIGQSRIARVRSAMVDHMINEFCKSRRIPFSYQQLWTERRSHPYSVIKNKNCKLDICQVRGQKEFPRVAKNRDKRAKTAQLSMFDPECEVDKYLYCIVTHGGEPYAQEPRFICIGRPDVSNRRWDSCSNILLTQYQHGYNTQDEAESLAMDFTDEAMRIIEGENSDGSKGE